MLFQFCQMCVFSLVCIHSFAPKVPNERRKFNVYHKKIEYQTANSPTKICWKYSRLLSIEQACVCGLVTMVNLLFSTRTEECLLLALCQPAICFDVDERNNSQHRWLGTKMPATNNSNNGKLFTQDFSFIFYFAQITYRHIIILLCNM